MKDRYRYVIAGNPNTPLRVLLKLVEDEDRFVRRRVAENSKVPEALLLQLARDPEPEVRVAAMLAMRSSGLVLLEACFSEDLDVRYMLAEEPDVPVEILRVLSQDPNPFVAHRAVCSLLIKAGGGASVV